MLSAVTPSLQTRAVARLSGFPGFLRANGFDVGGGDAVQTLQAAERVGVLEDRFIAVRRAKQQQHIGVRFDRLPSHLGAALRVARVHLHR